MPELRVVTVSPGCTQLSPVSPREPIANDSWNLRLEQVPISLSSTFWWR
jgi:hypothetical protein